MAEDFRQEANGLITAIGLYTDNSFFLSVPENDPDPTEENPLRLKSLSFLFNIGNIKKSTTVTIDIQGQSERKQFMPPTLIEAQPDRRTINLIAVMAPANVTYIGARTIYVTIGKEEYPFYFDIRRKSTDSMNTMPKSSTPTKKKRKAAVAVSERK